MKSAYHVQGTSQLSSDFGINNLKEGLPVYKMLRMGKRKKERTFGGAQNNFFLWVSLLCSPHVALREELLVWYPHQNFSHILPGGCQSYDRWPIILHMIA